MQNERKEIETVVISGMGVGALASAWGLRNAGKKVIMVNSRDKEFLRVQHVSLKERSYLEFSVSFLQEMLPQQRKEQVDTFVKALEKLNEFEQSKLFGLVNVPKQERLAYLQKNIEDPIVFNKLSSMLTLLPENNLRGEFDDLELFAALKNQRSVAIKDLERYMMRRIDELSTQDGDIKFYYHAQLMGIDMAHGTATICHFDKTSTTNQPIETVSFDHLIGADGTGRHALQEVNANLSEKVALLDDEFDINQHHMGAYLILERADGKPLAIPNDETLTDVCREREFGVYFDQNSYHKRDQKGVKISFGGELPADVTDKNSAIQYIHEAVKEALEKRGFNNGELIVRFSASQKYGPQKDKLKFGMFDVKLTEASTASVKVGERIFFLVGDSYRSPYYRASHGANDAIKHAVFMLEVIKKKATSEEYNAFCRDVSETPKKIIAEDVQARHVK